MLHYRFDYESFVVRHKEETSRLSLAFASLEYFVPVFHSGQRCFYVFSRDLVKVKENLELLHLVSNHVRLDLQGHRILKLNARKGLIVATVTLYMVKIVHNRAFALSYDVANGSLSPVRIQRLIINRTRVRTAIFLKEVPIVDIFEIYVMNCELCLLNTFFDGNHFLALSCQLLEI